MIKKINPPFTDQEIEILTGNFSRIAQTTEVSHAYVRQIAIGAREINTEKAKEILLKLQTLLSTLKQL